ncbi:YceD family protein [Minwuia sp.]|uniref:YceD family protein n=1 Tax=Minwuia sp. TaxID=2493630 RepID=UPI003A95272E
MNEGREDPAVSHWLDVSALSPRGTHFSHVFDDAARAALQQRLDVISVDRVKAEGRVWPAEDGVFVDFQLTGHVVQSCVVTLEPVGSDVDERVSLHYTPASSVPAEPNVVDINDEDDPPEPMVDDRIDIGAAMAEHLALGLDPWPRRPDAELPGSVTAEPRQNPFAVLAKLKKKLEDDETEDNGSGN